MDVMVRLLSRNDVGDLIDMHETIDAVEKGFRMLSSATIPQRIQIKKDDPHGELFVMPGFLDPDDGDQVLGMKTVTIFQDNDAFGIPRSLGAVQLFDAATGAIEVIMDGSHVTNYRTGAIGAVAARYLAPRDASVVAIIGSSTQARYQALALNAECDLETIKIYSRSAMKHDAVDFLQDRVDANVIATDSAAAACTAADIVATTTTATDPVFPAESVDDGALVVSLGSNDPSMREIPGSLMARAQTVYVDDYDLCRRVGDIADAIEEGHLAASEVVPLSDLVSGSVKSTGGAGVSVVKSVGTFALDIPVSQHVLAKALQKGRGTTFDLQNVE